LLIGCKVTKKIENRKLKTENMVGSSKFFTLHSSLFTFFVTFAAK